MEKQHTQQPVIGPTNCICCPSPPRLHKKHSTFFASMMAELGLEPQPEGYMDTAPWQLLACANHNFLLSERRAHYLRWGESAGHCCHSH